MQKHKRILYTDKNLRLIRNLREDSKLAIWLFFCTAKENNPSSHFNRNDFNNIGYSGSTVRLRLRQLKEIGWAYVTDTNKIILRSYKYISCLYGAEINHKKRRKYFGDTLQETVARAAGVYAEKNIHKQHKKLLKQGEHRYKATYAERFTDGVCLSVEWMQELLGFKTKQSGSRYFIFLEKELKMLKRNKQKQEFLGNVKNLDIESIRYIPNTYLSRKGGVYKCECKQIKLIATK